MKNPVPSTVRVGAGQLVSGELGLTHRWRSKGTDFACSSLYDALEQYRWPDNRNALDYRVTARLLRECRLDFEDIGAIGSRVKQTNFVNNAEAIFRWGGIRKHGTLNEWRSMLSERLHALMEDIRVKLWLCGKGPSAYILRGLNSPSVDVINLDQRLNSNRNYAAPAGNAEMKEL